MSPWTMRRYLCNTISTLLIVALWAITGLGSPTANIPASELSALYDLYNATNGPNWRWRPPSAALGNIWNFSANCNPCKDFWQGLNCNYEAPYNHINSITLDSYNLTGTLPDSLRSLTHLAIIELAVNQISGSFPAFIASLAKLQILGISSCYLTGSILESIGNITSLRQLSLQFNALTGTLPSSLGMLQALQTLNFAGNRLTGPLPASLGRLTSLPVLYLYDNRLTGTIPTALGGMVQLTDLYLELNYLMGPIPDKLYNLTRMRNLDLSNNFLTGTIPKYLGTFTALRNLYIHTNLLTGEIPGELGDITELQFLDLSTNQLRGTAPATLSQLQHLQYIQLYINQLTGTLPGEWCALAGLQRLDVNTNQITGQLPSNFNCWPKLLLFDASTNLLTGSIHSSIGNLSTLLYLAVNDNRITGTLPTVLSALPGLNVLHVQNNLLTGDLSSVFNATLQTTLASVEISSNQFTGSLPEALFALGALTSLVAVRNCFYGTLPASICGAAALESLVLDGLSSAAACRKDLLRGISDSYVIHKSVIGHIPLCLFTLPSLTTLHLSGNGFTGSLPDAPVSASLVDIIISHNRLTGTIPASIQQREWYNLDLSYNRLSGTLLSSSGTQPANLSAAAQAHVSTLYGTPYENLTLVPALSLENNRLSGKIPSTLVGLRNISVLGSNVFSCDLRGSNLPQNDDGRNNYECGSARFDVTYYVWLALLVVSAAALFVAWKMYGDTPVGAFATVTAYRRVWLEFSKEGRHFKARLTTFGHLMEIICRLSTICALYTIVVLLPVYFIASHYYGTYTHEYAWNASAAYLSGYAVLILELVLLVGLLCVVLIVFSRRIEKLGIKNYFTATALHPTVAQHAAICGAYIAINLFAVVGVNVAYVYIAIYQSSALLVLAQILLSFFKLLWNNVVTIEVLRLIVRTFAQKTELEASGYAESQFVTLQIAVALLNSIVVPCLVVAVISPSCFYNVFVASPSVTSYYTYQYCSVFTEAGTCQIAYTRIGSTSYDPPFAYSYQCSSSMITYYAPAFVNLCIISAFFSPVLQLLTPTIWNYLTPGSLIYKIAGKLISRLLRPPSPNPRAGIMYLQANQQLVILITYAGMLLTFGAMFPPLAVALALTISVSVFMAKLKVGRFLTLAAQLGLSQYTDILDRECDGVGTLSVLRNAMWMLITISCGFYTMFLFDTLGDQQGFTRSFWVIIVAPLLPACMYLVYRRVQPAADPAPVSADTRRPTVDASMGTALPDVELPDVSSAQHNKRTSKNLQSDAITHDAALELGEAVSEVADGVGVVFNALRDDDEVLQ